MKDQTKEYYLDKLYYFCNDNFFPTDLEKKKLVTSKFFDGVYDNLSKLSFYIRYFGDTIKKSREVLDDFNILERWAYKCEETFLKEDALVLNRENEISFIEGGKHCFLLIKRFIKLEKEEWRKRNG